MAGNESHISFIVQAGNFTATADYFDIRVDDYTRTMTVGNVIAALRWPCRANPVLSTR